MRRWVCSVLACAACAGLLLTIGHSQALPAPTVDRVGFPEGYQNWRVFYVFDRWDNRQVRVIYGNREAWEVRSDQSFFFPYGSIFVMETWRARVDAESNPMLDDNGRFQRDSLTGIFVMRKEPTFGEDYRQLRNGEWEYVAFRPDRSYLNTPSTTGGCAQCHLQAGQERDWVFRGHLFFKQASGAVPDLVTQAYRFFPSDLRVRAGRTITLYNDDEVEHTFTAVNGAFNSGAVRAGSSFSVKLEQRGEIEFRCTIHNNMRGRVVVE